MATKRTYYVFEWEMATYPVGQLHVQTRHPRDSTLLGVWHSVRAASRAEAEERVRQKLNEERAGQVLDPTTRAPRLGYSYQLALRSILYHIHTDAKRGWEGAIRDPLAIRLAYNAERSAAHDLVGAALATADRLEEAGEEPTAAALRAIITEGLR
jgi:hypothetical protein